jgi:hypothetical protein
MGFEKHLFISYAHLDNQPLTEQQQGWISRFHTTLSALLSMRMGRKAEIWRDSKLQGNDVFADEIVRQFPQTALLISVLTPRYVESDWCTREVREFCKTAEMSGGLVVENKSRVFKVIKTPVESEEQLPSVMKDALGYPFYIFDDEKTPIELDPSYGDDLAQKYNLKMAKLAWDIAQLIRKLETRAVTSEKPAVTPSASKPAIYLAECSFDRRDAREALEAEFRLHGYRVLPEHQLSREESEYVTQIGALLEQCNLSIHLVGASYGAVPDGSSEKSVVVLQNERAIERSKKGGLQRVIWIPEGTHSESPKQKEFISALHADAEAQFGADLITGDLENLKGAVHAALKKLEKPEPQLAEPQNGGCNKLIYLICDERDRKATIPIRKFLKAHGVDVQIPLFEGDAAAVRQANHDLLIQCDAVILFYGAGEEAWKRTVESDLRRIKADRAGRALVANVTYLADPTTDEKNELIELEEPNLINGLQGFSEAAIGPLIETLRRATQ